MSENDYIQKVRISNPKMFRNPAMTRITISMDALERILRESFRAGAVSAESEKSVFEKIFGK